MPRGSMTCQYEQLIGPRWPSDAGTVDGLWSSLHEPPWFEERPNRYGFVDLERYSDLVIMGYFAVEKPLHIVKYDEAKRREEHDEESFEHIWFGLFLSVGRLVAQRRRFIHQRLQADQVIQRLRETLALKFATQESPVLEFRPYERVIEKERFLAEYEKGRVQEVWISSLGGTSVPDDVRLFNPSIDKDAILKEVLGQDNRHIDKLSVEATKNGDLSRAKVVRGEMAAGDPSYLKRQDDDGKNVILHREVKETLVLPTDYDETRVTPSENDKERIVAEVEERPLPAPRRQPQRPGQSPLFSEEPEPNE